MADKAMPAKLTETIPPDILDALGAPPLLDIEEAKHYHAMIARLVDAIQPKDPITWMLIKDLADHRFDIARYRRIKAELMRHADPQAIGHQIALPRRRLQSDVEMLARKADAEASRAGPCDGNETRAAIRARLSHDIARREAETGRAIGDLQQSRSTEHDLALGFENWAPQHERFDGLLETAERRFSTTLARLERHLDGFARSLRANLERIIEVEPTGGLIDDAQPQSPSADTRESGYPDRLAEAPGSPLSRGRAE
jgi:hypothetical protein